jgi:SAM-dependent methyltransferase
MERVLEPEWLDELPSLDPRAQRSRADLRRLNAIMGNARHVRASLDPGVRTLLDLGAGDGDFARRIARPGMHVTLLDRLAFLQLEGETRVTAEARSFLSEERSFDAIVANLFLHHLDREALRELLELIARRARLFIACEPRRSRTALVASRLVWALGCNAVTRHDACASVRAGFCGRELSELWPRAAGWRLAERAALPFSHLFVARGDAPL